MTRNIRCGINIDPKNPRGRPTGQELKELGAEWVRFTFKDDTTGATPAQFAFYDQVVEQLAQTGIRILMILSYETLQGRPDRHASDADWDAYIQRFAARCGQIAEHYGGSVRAYQVWNEPDYLAPHPGYDPTIEPRVFGRMLKSCYEAIKAVSAATVVTGGLAAGQPGWLDGVREATSDRRIFADAVGVHPYGRRPEPNWPRADWGFGRLDLLLEEYYKSARLPIWITEMGTQVDRARIPRADLPNPEQEPARKGALCLLVLLVRRHGRPVWLGGRPGKPQGLLRTPSKSSRRWRLHQRLGPKSFQKMPRSRTS